MKYDDRRNGESRRDWIRFPLLIPVMIALILGFVAYLLTYHVNSFFLELDMKGQSHIILEYGQHYEEPGAEARFYGSHILEQGVDVDVRREGYVDEERLGRYELRYTAQYERWHAEQTRIVEIVDSVPPKILLIQKPGSYILPGEQYREEGYMARDNYDGDLTDQVRKILLKDKIIYEVSDSSGNRDRVVRDIVYYDPVPPEIVLKGGSSLTIRTGNDYQDPGYSATDNCDGDLTDRVQITGSVNTAKPGTYHVYYAVVDSYGNTDTQIRTVVVKEKARPIPSEKPSQPASMPSGKVIYLTFDDGPSQHTQRLLEILDQYDVKATFFVVNTAYSQLIGDIAEKGHAIGAHTYCHDYRQIYSGEDAYFADLNRILKLIKKKSGVDTKLIRFPGGSSNTSSRFNEGIMSRLTHEVVNRGYRYFDWNVDSNDTGGAKTAEEVYENVVNAVTEQRVSIVLQHDIKGYSVDAVEMIIKWGLENGYQFLPLSQDSPTAAHDIRN